MSEVHEYSLTNNHEENQQDKNSGLSRFDRMKAAVYGVAAEVNQMESPYEDAAAIKTGDTLMVLAERGVRKVKEMHGRNRMHEPPRRLKETTKPLQKSDFAIA